MPSKTHICFIIFIFFISLTAFAPFTRDDPPKLFVFVGTKLHLDTMGWGWERPDFVFRARYKIEERIYGDYEGDTIEFKVYNRFGNPPFMNLETILLYVSDTGPNNTWVQEKYQYQEVYKAKNGKWAGQYDQDSYDYIRNYHCVNNISPEKIPFSDSLYFLNDPFEKHMGYPYNYPWYICKKERYYPVMGNYARELFLLKRNGILRARGFF